LEKRRKERDEIATYRVKYRGFQVRFFSILTFFSEWIRSIDGTLSFSSTFQNSFSLYSKNPFCILSELPDSQDSESQPTPFNLHKAKKRVENFKKREAKNPRKLIKPREAVRVLNQETNSIIEEKERAIGPDNLKKLKDLRKSFYLQRTVILSSLDRLIQPEFARFGFGDHFREAIKAVDLVLIEVRSKV
jgi:hypothetical protein